MCSSVSVCPGGPSAAFWMRSFTAVSGLRSSWAARRHLADGGQPVRKQRFAPGLLQLFDDLLDARRHHFHLLLQGGKIVGRVHVHATDFLFQSARRVLEIDADLRNRAAKAACDPQARDDAHDGTGDP